MKVSLLMGAISRNSGGLFNSVRMIGQAMDKRAGLSIEIVGHSDEYTDIDVHNYLPLVPKFYKIIGPSNLGFSLDLSNLLNEIKPDIIHPQCIWMNQSYHSLKYHKNNGTPIIISPRGMMDEWTLKNSAWKKKIVGQLYENRHLKNTNYFHALAQSEAESIRATGLKQPVVIIPNGINLPQEKEENILPSWYQNLNESNQNRRKVLFFGRIHPKKGLDNLLESWEIFKEINKDWILIIAGWGDETYVNNLKKRVTERGLQEQIHFTGGLFGEQKKATFRNVDAFILPSFSEGLPMAILEAWSYKLPVIMTEFCNIPVGFTANAALKVLPTKESILEGLVELTNTNQEKLIQIGENGYELVKEKFTWKQIATDMHSVYEWMQGGNKPTNIEILD
jgi:poly(glycerol-phosphate) alpha-glucosyltransferase